MKLMKKIGAFHLTARGLRLCGIVFLAAGLVGTLIQVHLLGAGISNIALFDALEADSSLMGWTTLAVVGQGLEACAMPIFAFLLAEGAAHTSSFGRYFLRVLCTAAISQMPYNLLMTGSLLGFDGGNPVFAAVMSMIVLFFFRHFSERTAGHIAIKGCAVLFAFLWCNLLGVAHGAVCVLVTAVLWRFRGKQNLQTTAGVVVTLCCAVFSMFYLIALSSFLLTYFYDGTRGKGMCNHVARYTAYPLLIFIFSLASVFR